MWLERTEKALASVLLDSSLMNRLHPAHVGCTVFVSCAFVQGLCVLTVTTAMHETLHSIIFRTLKQSLDLDGRTS